MPTRTKPWPTGVPCWVDLTVSDVPKAQEFYSAVLGWTFLDDDATGYSIAQVQGQAAAGIGPTPQPGVPSAWTMYFAADDADAIGKAVTDAGGTMLLPPGDVGPLGRLLVAADPTGAVFGVWQHGEHIGAGWHSEPGGLTWEDLRSPDPDRAREFYAAVFGHETQALDAAGPGYTTFTLGGAGDQAPLGGMGPMFGAPEGTPAHWLVYFATADLDAALAAVAEHGGTQPAGPQESPYGRMGVVTDPFGATFMLMQSDSPAPPER